MIVLLSYSTSWCGNRCYLSSTGGVGDVPTPPDSVLISVQDLKIATAKMLELKYEKEINEELRQIISNDSTSISVLRMMVEGCDYEKKVLKKQRTIFQGTTVVSVILLLISLL